MLAVGASAAVLCCTVLLLRLFMVGLASAAAAWSASAAVA